VSEIYIFPEMLKAGEEAVSKCEAAKADRETTAYQVYVAMQAVLLMRMLKNNGSIH
jgi:hypothetical protein